MRSILRKNSSASTPAMVRLERLDQAHIMLGGVVKALCLYQEKMARHTSASVVYAQALSSLLYVEGCKNLSPTFVQSIELFVETYLQVSKIEGALSEESGKLVQSMEKMIAEFEPLKGVKKRYLIANEAVSRVENKGSSTTKLDFLDRYKIEASKASTTIEHAKASQELKEILEKLEDIVECGFVNSITKYYQLKHNSHGLIYACVDSQC
eukprot:TRINITY_DN5180_c0_g1_i3.p1 TRINITY_DN5180_c0_g1~~TRINITY_DN5180_c0_g1_i3.p1  ORF type:complete len:210 (-),score=43.41 TRINITY_DN5180_c0_g1_i3:85-714(-)